MVNTKDLYNLQVEADTNAIRFYFLSKGKVEKTKTVQYNLIGTYDGKQVYNLGFGNYSSQEDVIDDNKISNNGDHYKVFNTVLSTVPLFFNFKNGTSVMVMGSDSGVNFTVECRINCNKNCSPTLCKNHRRRIKAYQAYLKKKWQLLILNYLFKGGWLNSKGEIKIEDYNPLCDYDAIIISLKKL